MLNSMWGKDSEHKIIQALIEVFIFKLILLDLWVNWVGTGHHGEDTARFQFQKTRMQEFLDEVSEGTNPGLTTFSLQNAITRIEVRVCQRCREIGKGSSGHVRVTEIYISVREDSLGEILPCNVKLNVFSKSMIQFAWRAKKPFCDSFQSNLMMITW